MKPDPVIHASGLRRVYPLGESQVVGLAGIDLSVDAGALVVLKAISADPGRSLGKLHRVQDDQDVREQRLGEEAGKWAKIRLIGRDNHGADPKPIAEEPFYPPASP